MRFPHSVEASVRDVPDRLLAGQITTEVPLIEGATSGKIKHQEMVEGLDCING